ncbi:MAG: lipocalin-like domain-containing protein [Gammaproteobacteria bacterium]
MSGARTWLLTSLLVLTGCEESSIETPSGMSGLRIDTLLGESDAAFARADQPKAFSFPLDHGPHPAYRSEWWYLTAVLQDSAGNDYGLHYTLFRQALNPQAPGEGPWLTGQAYLGHLAVTDVSKGLHLEAERFARGHPDLAGVRIDDGFAATIEDWTLHGSADPAFNLTLAATEHDQFSVNLDIRQTQSIVLQGERGWSEKAPGSASYYYSVPRLDLNGTLEIEGREVSVTGLGWLDREWSTSVLAEGLEGWDWFALQLDDGRSIMAFQLRRQDGQRDDYDHGLLVDRREQAEVSVAAAGTPGVTLLKPHNFTLQAVRYHLDDTGIRWPVTWQLRIGDEDFTIRAMLDDQRMDLSIVYWEGIVEVLDSSRKHIGRGYMELTGYTSAD